MGPDSSRGSSFCYPLTPSKNEKILEVCPEHACRVIQSRRPELVVASHFALLATKRDP